MAPSSGGQKKYTTKKCPYCATYVKYDAIRCDSCNRKIGPANEFGIAKKPLNIGSYIVAIGAVAALVVYLVWAFGR